MVPYMHDVYIPRKVFIAYLKRGGLCFDGMYKFNIDINKLLYYHDIPTADCDSSIIIIQICIV